DWCISFEIKTTMLNMDNFQNSVLRCRRLDLIPYDPELDEKSRMVP
ncbi:hypothetical protein NPIL_571801, partial [Nephila pilipes]